jgi:cation diffusion facilitator CzcD-associated flavoprotein CzcO
MANFKGTIFHTAEWQHSVDLDGKKIGYIGTGSTAAQAIPELINLPGTKVTIFQRTAQWLIPAKDRSFDDKDKAWKRSHPVAMRIQRNLALWSFAQMTSAITGDGLIDKLLHKA